MSCRPEIPFADPGDNFPGLDQTSSAVSASPSATTTAPGRRRARSRAVNSGDFFLVQQLRNPGLLPALQDRYCCPQNYIDLVGSWRRPPFEAATSQVGWYFHQLFPLHSSSSSSSTTTHNGSFGTSAGPCEAEAIGRTRRMA
jgi:hypothetical protein